MHQQHTTNPIEVAPTFFTFLCDCLKPAQSGFKTGAASDPAVVPRAKPRAGESAQAKTLLI
jgi:hypothetical protein